MPRKSHKSIDTVIEEALQSKDKKIRHAGLKAGCWELDKAIELSEKAERKKLAAQLGVVDPMRVNPQQIAGVQQGMTGFRPF